MCRLRITITIAVTYFCLTGCAAIINGTNDNINVNSNSKNTVIYLNDQPYAKGFASISVKRGQDYFLTGKLPGCQDANIKINWKIDSLAAISFLTLPFDLAIGSAWKVEHPSYLLNPSCNDAIAESGLVK